MTLEWRTGAALSGPRAGEASRWAGRLARRARIALRLLLPNADERAYLGEIRQSGLFDRGFYRAANPGLHWLFRALPERHYVLFGERAGLHPNRHFSPLQHWRRMAAAGVPALHPLRHYLRHGGAVLPEAAPEAGPPTLGPPTLGPPPPRGAAQAIALHLFYEELWPEFAAVFRGLDIGFDLYVTLCDRGRETAATAARIRADFPGARVLTMPNRGRDILPFLRLVNAGWLDGYEAVAKLHSKRSPHLSDGDGWRRHLTGGILPRGRTASHLARFKADAGAGFWVADGQHFTGAEWWGANFARTAELLAPCGIAPRRAKLSFPAGSIYWLKPAMIAAIRNLGLTADAFEPEYGQTDGTLAHAVERALGALAGAAGLAIRETAELAGGER